MCGSVSEQFFEVDLAAILDIPGYNEGLFGLSEEERFHWLKVFALVFRRDAFLPTPSDGRTFHQRALEEGHFYEQRVAANLSNLVFGLVFPTLAQAIAAAAPAAPLQEVREAALILLYRLLFIVYTEDRNLLPVRDSRYDDYCASGYAGMSEAGRIARIPFRRPPPAIGRSWTIFAARSTPETDQSACRRTMAACSIPSVHPC